MILYIEKPKATTKSVLELINKFSKVAGYKINIQKSIVSLCKKNEINEKEIRKAILFILAIPKLKYLLINLSRKVNELHNGNCKSSMRK
jgi:hypothetical protein